MNNGRALTFILLSSLIMMTALMLQGVFAPDKPKQANEDPPAAADNSDPAEQNKNAGESAATDSETPAQSDIQPEPIRTSQDDFVTIGSLAEDGSDRYLVTINKRGGTIRRIELNFRDSKGRYKYRDIVWDGGYLGCLECVDSDQGVQVRVVGPGTPAAIAGVEVGDIITAVDQEAVVTAAGFESYLETKTKPGSEILLSLKRSGAKRAVTVELTNKPLEIIRPEPGIVDPDFDFPESFITALVKPGNGEELWPDLDPGMRESNWQVVEGESANTVELQFDLSPAKLKELDLVGPISVIKRYSIPPIPEDSFKQINSRSFHLKFELEVKNDSDRAQQLAYEIDGPTGTTAETWWYANKIHGRQTAIGYVAGARDVVGSTSATSYIFYGGPEIVDVAESPGEKPPYICNPFRDDVRHQELNWVGVDSQYFNVSLIPVVSDNEKFVCNSVTAYINTRKDSAPKIPENARLKRLVDCTFQLVAPLEIPAGQSVSRSFEIFVGPKDPDLLDNYQLSDVRTFGWFSWCSIVLLQILHFFYWITFKTSYGLAIIMLTVLVRSLMIPMSRKAALNAQMMQHLQPQMKEIADKYKDDFEKRAAAQRELYQKYKFNPFGGCFMMFFQLPVFYGLYKGLNVDIALRDQPLIPGMSWCSNLSAPDQFLYWKDWMPAALGDETGWLGPYLNILPLITMVLFIAQQKLFTPPPTDDQQKMMQKMMTFMMLFMGIMFFKVPAGLCLYFITSSLWGIIERKLLPKPKLDTDNLVVAGGGPSSGPTKPSRAQRKEEQQREADAEARRQRNAERKRKLKKRDK